MHLDPENVPVYESCAIYSYSFARAWALGKRRDAETELSCNVCELLAWFARAIQAKAFQGWMQSREHLGVTDDRHTWSTSIQEVTMKEQ